MPKAAIIHRGRHHASVKLPQTVAPTTSETSLLLDPPNLEKLGAQPGPSVEAHIQQSKKDKKLEKRKAFLQKLEPSTRQVSKSHQRRLKRKTREQLTGGLEDLRHAIFSLEKEGPGTEQDQADASTTIAISQDKTISKPNVTIMKSSSATLSNAQRKRVLELERLRHPLILTNSQFSSNPFQTIRTHAQNTLLTGGSQKSIQMGLSKVDGR